MKNNFLGLFTLICLQSLTLSINAQQAEFSMNSQSAALAGSNFSTKSVDVLLGTINLDVLSSKQIDTISLSGVSTKSSLAIELCLDQYINILDIDDCLEKVTTERNIILGGGTTFLIRPIAHSQLDKRTDINVNTSHNLGTSIVVDFIDLEDGEQKLQFRNVKETKSSFITLPHVRYNGTVSIE